MIWLEIPVIALLSIYTILISTTIFVLLFAKKEDDLLTDFIPNEKISIIIPFRNEVHTILNCLKSIVEQDFPRELLELILVDDHSEDNSKQVSDNFLQNQKISYVLIDLKEKQCLGKKAAIELAVSQSSGKIIVTRDADTYTGNKFWLKSIAHHFYTSKTDLLLAPVILSGKSFIQAFQLFENLAISAIGYAFSKINLPFVCSGANLAYTKDSFVKANPYKNNKNISSGDDMFLLQSFIKQGFTISGTKNSNAIVYTNAEITASSCLNQRIRWASKTKNLHIKTTWFIGILLFLTNILALITLFLRFLIPTIAAFVYLPYYTNA